MSKIIEASCEAGVVTIEELPIAEAVILSEGVGPSEGVAVIEGDEVTYIADTTPDLKLTIEKAIDAITKLGSTLTTIGTELTAIGAGMTGPTTSPPPTLPVTVATIIADVVELTAIAAELATLKETLR